MEIIKSIEEVENIKLPSCSYSTYTGFKVTTDKQEILLLIDDSQNCCEDWGYFLSQDDFKDFIGAQLYGIKHVDESLRVDELPKNWDGNGISDECATMFINLETSNGTLQFTAYNEHNGYYGHNAALISNQLKYETTL